METVHKAVLIAGLVVAVALFIFLRDIYVFGIVIVILFALAIAFQIQGETRNLPPRLTCWLSEDAKKIVLRNEGNARAVRIHMTLVPLDREFDLPELPADGRREFPVPSMISEAKAILTYEDDQGLRYSRSVLLSATTRGEEDLLKPVFPLFGWK